ncbi:MAG: type VI secretion system baseplate subunit TssE [Litoreibacter sp.]
MPDTGFHATARQELVQPSLWDRLVDDLPGVVAETDSLMHELRADLGPDFDLDLIIDGGTRAVERCVELDDETRQRLHFFVSKIQLRRKLEERGIVMDSKALREAVRRDIEMLFNIERMETELMLSDAEHLRFDTPAELLTDFPLVRSSVLNYGVPSFSGRRGSDFDKDVLEREIRQVLHAFEPRLKKNSVRVKVIIDPKTGMRIDIDGVLSLSPVPERLRLSTSIDLDNGNAATTVEDA